MSDFTKAQLFELAKGDYNTYVDSGMKTFLNSSKHWYEEYKKKGGKKKLEHLEDK